MDDLSIFICAPSSSWDSLISCVTTFLGSGGGDSPDGEPGERHTWSAAGFELIAVSDVDYVDDLEIPFSKYNFHIQFALCDREHHAEYNRLQFALSRVLVMKLRQKVSQNTILVKDLQSEVAV